MTTLDAAYIAERKRDLPRHVYYRKATDSFRIVPPMVRGEKLRESTTRDKSEAVRLGLTYAAVPSTVAAKMAKVDQRTTVQTYAARYIADETDSGEWSASTTRRYESIVRTCLADTRFGRMRLADVGRSDVAAHLKMLRRHPGVRTGRPLSTATIAGVWTFLSGMFAHAASDGRLAVPVEMPKAPKADTAPVDPPTREEIRTFLEYLDATDDRLAPLYRTAVETGMRIGELLALSWSDVQLGGERPSITVAATLDDHTRQRGEPKTIRSRRTFRIQPSTAAMLDAWKARQLAESDGVVDFDRFVFTNSHGQPFFHTNVRTHLARRLAASGVAAMRADRGAAPMTFHDFRHFFVTYKLAERIATSAVAFHVGDTERVIQRTYAHFVPEIADQVVAADMTL